MAHVPIAVAITVLLCLAAGSAAGAAVSVVSVLDKGHTAELISIAAALSKDTELEVTLHVVEEAIVLVGELAPRVKAVSLGATTALLALPPSQKARSPKGPTSSVRQRLAAIDNVLISAQQPSGSAGSTDNPFVTLNHRVAQELLVQWQPPPACVVCSAMMTGCVDAAELLAVPVVLYSVYSARFIFPHLALPLPAWLPVSDPFLPFPGLAPLSFAPALLNAAVRWLVSLPLAGALNAARTESRAALGLLAAPTWLAPRLPHSVVLGSAVGLEASWVLPDQVCMVGLVAHPAEESVLPLELGAWLDHAGGAVVYIASGGSGVEVFSAQVVAALAAALLGVNASVLWAGQPPPASKALLPEARWERWVPQWAVLAHPAVQLMVCHGGPRSVKEAAVLGVPLVLLPLGGDQMANTQNAVDAGFGLDGTGLGLDALREVVDTALHSRTMRAAAQRVGEALQAQGGAGAAAKWVKKVAQGASRGTKPEPGSPEVVYCAVGLVVLLLLLLCIALCGRASKALEPKKRH